MKPPTRSASLSARSSLAFTSSQTATPPSRGPGTRSKRSAPRFPRPGPALMTSRSTLARWQTRSSSRMRPRTRSASSSTRNSQASTSSPTATLPSRRPGMLLRRSAPRSACPGPALMTSRSTRAKWQTRDSLRTRPLTRSASSLRRSSPVSISSRPAMLPSRRLGMRSKRSAPRPGCPGPSLRTLRRRSARWLTRSSSRAWPQRRCASS
mmetsp:Transcript_71533/g.165415  ORF Transcript_71533/g.165415 Transcript_71533/m.165415 type:complete len:209 (-) Transcript_71533:617-1243(-)